MLLPEEVRKAWAGASKLCTARGSCVDAPGDVFEMIMVGCCLLREPSDYSVSVSCQTICFRLYQEGTRQNPPVMNVKIIVLSASFGKKKNCRWIPEGHDHVYTFHLAGGLPKVQSDGNETVQALCVRFSKGLYINPELNEMQCVHLSNKRWISINPV